MWITMKHNYDKWLDRTHKLRQKGAFRTPLPSAQWESIEAPKFAGKVHGVTAFVGPEVEDTEGKRFPIKQVLAVGGTAHDVELPEELFPNAARRTQQKQALKEYADQLKAKLRDTGQLALANAVQYVKGLAGFVDTLEVQRFPRQARYIKFFRLFDFSVEGSGVKITVDLPKGRPSGSSGASSSGGAPAAPPAPALIAEGSKKKPISLLLDRMKAARQ